MTSQTDFDLLLQRVGRPHLQQRLTRQVEHVSDALGPGLTHLHVENLYWTHWFIRKMLQCAGLYRRGQRNALSPRIRHHTVRIRHLPELFHGFRILHLSDLHSDLNTGIVSSVIERIRHEPYDLCVLTGDYRSRTFGPFDLAVSELLRLRAALRGPAYAVLGNHDFIEMVAPLEAAGIRVLLNESVLIPRGSQAICLAGVDDPHYYAVDNLEKAAHNLRPDVPGILLAHTPEIYQKAERCGFQYLLCGHTHGGQICLPGSLPLVLNVNCPRTLCAGPWRYQALQGYTSCGAGVSGVDVRFNCPGEITIHHLAAWSAQSL